MHNYITTQIDMGDDEKFIIKPEACELKVIVVSSWPFITIEVRNYDGELLHKITAER